MLQNGVYIDNISFANIKAKQLYIKWDEKLDVSLKDIQIITSQSGKENSFDYKEINNTLKKLSHTRNWFNSIIIENIKYNDISASFKYLDGEDGFVLASSDSFKLKLALTLKKEILQINIEKFQDIKHNISANGKLFYDTKKLQLYSNVNLTIQEEAAFTLYGLLNTQDIFYKLQSTKDVTDYKYLISLAQLPKEVMLWAYDALVYSTVTIHNISGYIDFNDINNAYKNIHILADVNDLVYTYNKNLDAINTAKTELEFKNGILYIRPKKASSYNMPLGKSWLKIDFTKKEELLTLFLLFDAQLNKDMLHILDIYKIKLPFLQNSGTVCTDLKIEVALQTIKIDAQGKFYTKKANFDYLGLNINIYDATIKLDNYDVTIPSMLATYKDIAIADVNVSYNASKQVGKIGFNFRSVKLQDLLYDSNESILSATYNISPEQDSISVTESHWKYKKQSFTIDEAVIPFDLETLKLTLPTTYVSLENIGSAFISGNVDVKNFSTSINVDILKFSYDGVELTQSNTPVTISYDKELSLYSDNEIHFSVSGSIYTAKNLFIKMDEDAIRIKHTQLKIGKYIKTKIYAKYDKTTKKSHISLSDFILTDPNTNKTLYKNNKILISAKILKDSIEMTSKEIDASFISQSTGWRLKISSLGRVAKNSDFLKMYHAEKGSFTLYRNKDDRYTRFKAKLIYPYKILVKNNKPVENYSIKGRIYHEKVYLDINDKIDITIKDDINVKFSSCGINLNEVIRAFKDIPTQDNNDNSLNLFLNATNSFLYLSDKRKVLYDTLDMQYYNGILNAQLAYKNGIAGLKYEKSEFHLYGKEFNDTFMDKLFSLSKFTDGSLDFSMSGNTTDYKGVVFVHDTTIKDYKTLNNILAFINTVPSLVTFSLPGYSKNGLLIDKAYLTFTFADNIFDFSDIYIDSQEMRILGKGNLNIEKDDMDITLNLKTDLGRELSKVPLVGYLLLDGDTISTSLSIKGKTSDPEVNSLIATDIAVAPLNIIKRTLMLPYKLVKDAAAKVKKEKE